MGILQITKSKGMKLKQRLEWGWSQKKTLWITLMRSHSFNQNWYHKS